MRGRPRKEKTIDHMVGTRLNDDQFAYLKSVAYADHCSLSTALRNIIEEYRNEKGSDFESK